MQKKEPANLNALGRITFGLDSEILNAVSKKGFEAWLDEQLKPLDRNDLICNKKIAEFRLPIKYGANKDGYWPAVDELRPFQYLTASSEQLMSLITPGRRIDGQEEWRPAREVMCATLIRSVYSRWQVREVITQFWHDHFNVNGWDGLARLMLPVYDREVIRANVFGNFRQMLESVAKSAAMQSYLNNRSSRAGAPNENFARELFELHTMGSKSYMNNLYNKWRDVPGASSQKPAGYIDQDVYEAARAFTGWSVADGASLGDGKKLPRTGEFIYVDSWHDQYQKRILAREIDPYQAPLKDGLIALDLVAFHPATAHYLSSKLCIRLVSDHPPESLVKSAAAVWMANQKHPRQIAKVIEHIVLSQDFMAASTTKVKRPTELLASLIRTTGQPFQPTIGLIDQLNNCGQRLFGWVTPAGLPDDNARWLGANAIWQRWNLIAGIVDNSWQCGSLDAFALVGSNVTVEEFSEVCFSKFAISSKTLKGDSFGKEFISRLIEASGLKPNTLVTDPVIARRMIAWSAMSPSFQMR